jgi:AGZA family xanthine/uracil permease-like MFS transporter
MLGAMFFQPVVAMVMGDFGPGRYPTLSAALVVVGAIMMRSLRDIEWDEPTESIPAFLTMVFIPLSFSIADGIALGLIAFAALKLLTGRGRQVPALIYVFAAILSLRYILPAVGLMP